MKTKVSNNEKRLESSYEGQDTKKWDNDSLDINKDKSNEGNFHILVKS